MKKEEHCVGFNKKMNKPLRMLGQWIAIIHPLEKFSFMKIMPTFKVKSMVTIISKTVHKGPTKGYSKDLL
jgi:hypothetical protein